MTYFHDLKNNGYFVEIGACNSINQSQCFYFEKYLNWNGIAVEPQKRFFELCSKNRKTFCNKCIGDKKSTVKFIESIHHDLSGVESELLNIETNFQKHKTDWRDDGYKEYNVEMITLLDLLKCYNSPKDIDYLAMDCEGCEYPILKHFFDNNNNYLIKFISVEVPRKDLPELILQNNYTELINPILPLKNGRIVNYERYFIHNTQLKNIEK